MAQSMSQLGLVGWNLMKGQQGRQARQAAVSSKRFACLFTRRTQTDVPPLLAHGGYPTLNATASEITAKGGLTPCSLVLWLRTAARNAHLELAADRRTPPIATRAGARRASSRASSVVRISLVACVSIRLAPPIVLYRTM